MPNPDFVTRNPEIEKLMNEIGGILKGIMPPGWGFTLFITDYHEDTDPDKGNMFYLSSIRREDMIKSLLEFVERQKTL